MSIHARYPRFFSIPESARFSFENHRVFRVPKTPGLPDISGIPEILGIQIVTPKDILYFVIPGHLTKND